jgi:glyoxylase-like metal-dependent hydrolase (beta-lactamase superfamily II)
MTVLFAALLVHCSSASHDATGDGANVTGAPKPAAAIGVYTSDWARGFQTRTVFYDTGTEVIAFDAQFTPDLAREAIQAIDAATGGKPITYLVITHPNPDKFNGVGPFRARGAKIVASAATANAIPAVHAYKKNFWINVAKQFTDATYPPEATVDETFDGTRTLTSNGHTVVLSELANAAVTSTQTVAFVADENALVVGDVVHYRAHAWLEGPIPAGDADASTLPGPDLAAWARALDELQSSHGDARVFGGRGGEDPVGGVTVSDAASEQKAYLARMKDIVTADLARVGIADRPGLYAAIEKDAQAAFPAYVLPDMIQFGVYGLVDELAKSE